MIWVKEVNDPMAIGILFRTMRNKRRKQKDGRTMFEWDNLAKTENGLSSM